MLDSSPELWHIQSGSLSYCRYYGAIEVNYKGRVSYDRHIMWPQQSQVLSKVNSAPPVACMKETSRKNISVWAEWLRQSGRAPSELSETPQWWNTPCPASIQRIALQIAIQAQFHCVFWLWRSPILNKDSCVEANCDHTSEWIQWVRACIGIAMRWVMLRKSLLTFVLSLRKMQFSLYRFYTSFEVARSMWLLTIDRFFLPSPFLLLETISAIMCPQPTTFRTLKTCQAMTAVAFLTCTNFQTGSKLPEFSGIVMSASANLYSTKAPSSFSSVVLNNHCSRHGRRSFSAP